MAISSQAKAELKTRIKTELENEFGASQDVAVLTKYANAMGEAIAEEFFKHGYFPDDTEYPAGP